MLGKFTVGYTRVAGDQNEAEAEYWESIGKGQRIQCDHTLSSRGFFCGLFVLF